MTDCTHLFPMVTPMRLHPPSGKLITSKPTPFNLESPSSRLEKLPLRHTSHARRIAIYRIPQKEGKIVSAKKSKEKVSRGRPLNGRFPGTSLRQQQPAHCRGGSASRRDRTRTAGRGKKLSPAYTKKGNRSHVGGGGWGIVQKSAGPRPYIRCLPSLLRGGDEFGGGKAGFKLEILWKTDELYIEWLLTSIFCLLRTVDRARRLSHLVFLLSIRYR